MSDLHNLIWVPMVVLLAHIPMACYFDIKDREMPKGFWNMLVIICAPITVLLYAAGIYPIEAALVSIICCILYFVAITRGWFEGADFWFLAFISLFFVTNPISGHSLMALEFFIFLVASVVIFGIFYQTRIFDKWILPKYHQFPMMLQISLALILTVVLG